MADKDTSNKDIDARVAEVEDKLSRLPVPSKKSKTDDGPSLAELNKRSQQIANERLEEKHDVANIASNAIKDALSGRVSKDKKRTQKDLRTNAPKS